MRVAVSGTQPCNNICIQEVFSLQQYLQSASKNYLYRSQTPSSIPPSSIPPQSCRLSVAPSLSGCLSLVCLSVCEQERDHRISIMADASTVKETLMQVSVCCINLLRALYGTPLRFFHS